MHHTGKKTGIFNLKIILFTVLSGCLFALSCAQQPRPMKITTENPLAQKFYASNNNNQFWFSSNNNIKRANEWLDAIDSAANFGLVSDQIQIKEARIALEENNQADTVLIDAKDQQITGLVLNFIKELQEGNIKLDYDGVSTPRDSVYASQLLNSKLSESVSDMIDRLDCKDPDYVVYKKFLNDSLTEDNTLKYKTILLAINYRRYLSLNSHSEYIVANIPAAEVEYYRNDKPVLKMRSVAGKKKNKTPTIASFITDIVTFPYWHVPNSIASKELLPKVQMDETYLEQNNFEVVDANGNVVDDYDLEWADYTEKTFPYFFRESTGPNNSLGVLKFNLQNPYSIYLHDTNSKWAFEKDYRFLSHGCIRLEKPVELAQLLAGDKIDTAALKTGKQNTETQTIMLDKKIPLFIIYMPVKLVGQQVNFIPDVYGLVK